MVGQDTLNRGTKLSKIDPTRTTILRRSFEGELYKKLRRLKGLIRQYVVADDGLKIKGGRDVNESQIIKFERWLENKYEEVNVSENVGKYVKLGYQRGISRGIISARGFNDSAAASLIGNAAKDTLAALQGRALRDVDGLNKTTRTAVMRVLSDGVMAGDTPEQIAKAINDRVDKIGITRARIIAQTEIVRAHAEGVLDSLETLGVKEVKIVVEWQTVGDERVCPLCKPLEGLIISIKQARGIFPRHPRCRCSPVAVERTPYSLHKSRIKAAVDRSVKAEIPKSLRSRRKSAKQQRRRSLWKGSKL